VALEELRRAAGIVSQLRDLHRQSQPEHRELIDVNELLGRVLTLSKGKCRDRGIELVWEPDQDLPSIPLVPDRIQQVFLNLTLNAIDAMPRGGRLAIETRQTGKPAGLQIAFRDTGVGIDEQSLEHLFEPFYSTKPDGLGLGLFITQNIIDEHGGRIEAESELGRGTTFRVWLPAGDGGEG
jgi:two-component system NtrC family sensor kinase